MSETPIDKTVATFQVPTFVVAHTPGNPAAGGPDEVTVEIEHDGDQPPIRVVTQNEALMAATTAPTSATRAYGIGAKLDPAGARRLAQALVEAADEIDPQPKRSNKAMFV